MSNLKDAGAKAVNAIHRSVFLGTNGRLLGKIGSMQVVALTTTGRKSGAKRQTMLTAPLVEGERVVLVASYGGDPKHPAWYLNLQANPTVEIVMAGKKRTMTARTATADEKADLWPRITGAYKGYAGYQTRTDRDIPVVLLDPA